jgi:hypothetical protein
MFELVAGVCMPAGSSIEPIDDQPSRPKLSRGLAIELIPA